MHAGHQGRARGRARGAHIEVLQPRALGGEFVHIWRLQQWMSIRTPVAVALIIGQDEEDVRLGRRGGIGGSGRAGQ